MPLSLAAAVAGLALGGGIPPPAETMTGPRSAPQPDALRPEGIPPRPRGAEAGSQFAAATLDLEGPERQRLARDQLEGGNLPDFLRRFVPVHLEPAGAGEGEPAAVIWVAPDYLAIGDDDDFLRIPLDLPSAVEVARRFGCVLPTRKMVDAIYQQAQVKLRPAPMNPGPEMRSTGYFLRHQLAIERQRAGARAGLLVAGHKKDVVLTNRLRLKPGRVAIYGWHRLDGEPIQPLSTAHPADYADYSHGVRLVYGRARVGGRWQSLLEALEDPHVADALSYEGAIDHPRELMDGAAGS